MACSCGKTAGGAPYEVVGADGTVHPVNGSSRTGTLDEARAKAATLSGAWVRKA